MPRKNKNNLSKLLFSEKFFPSRPKNFWLQARELAERQIRPEKIGPASSLNTAYVLWLKKESMLANANKLAREYSGKARLWQNPYAKPQSRKAVKQASVWYTAYPMSMVTEKRVSILKTLGDDELWKAFSEIGIKGMHTGPMKRAGGLDGWNPTPSIDGHFDRVSNKIDRIFGSETDFQNMCDTAAKHGGIILDDLVPGHTGKGADFRLAEMNYRDYPGIYHMVEIAKKDWSLLPSVQRGHDSANLDQETEEALKKAGYIIGKLQRVIFYEPGIKETNWSVTKPVLGVDGVKRRWVYLHYFKGGQPSLNWLDPSFASMKLVVGDALHSISRLGTKGLRLDANGFLGIERTDDDTPAWSEGHPLSGVANQLISGMVRKLGGFTFQELNLSVDDIASSSEGGADLSYDFINRPAYHHALVTGKTEFLQLMLRTAIDLGIDAASLVHALQNHDELTTEMVHFLTLHKDDDYQYEGKTMKGSELREKVCSELLSIIHQDSSPYNLRFTENGIACTTASIIAAVIQTSNFDDDEIAAIKKVHLLLATFNAMQPGVFALSGWDLSGSLTLDPSSVPALLSSGDTRWINRGAYDLMDKDPNAKLSAAGIPRPINLYGSLPDQLADPDSFASQLKVMLSVREKYGIPIAKQIDIPNTDDPAILVMVHELADNTQHVSVLNFSNKEISTTVESKHLKPKSKVVDMFNSKNVSSVTSSHTFDLTLGAYESASLHIV